MNKKFFIANVILLTIVIALFEGVSHTIIKAKIGDYDLATQGGTTMTPSFYQVWEHPAGYKSWSGKTEFNNYGLRDRDDLTQEKPDNTVRIFFIGGSAAFGSQAMPGSMYLKLSGQGEYSNEETITYYLEEKLKAKYPEKNFEVINAATNWSRLHQQMLHYLRKLRTMEPDLIISMDAYNDSSPIHLKNTYADAEMLGQQELFGNLKHKISPIFQVSHTAYFMAMMIFRTGESFEPDMTLVEKYAAIKAPDNMDEQIGKARIEMEEQLQTNVHEYMSAMKNFDSVLDNDNVPHMFYLQPLTILDTYKEPTQIEDAIRGYQYDTLNEGQYLRLNFYSDIEFEANKLKDEGVLEFESMIDVFKGVKDVVYSDYCHFTPKGNELLAEYFLKEIEEKHPDLLQ